MDKKLKSENMQKRALFSMGVVVNAPFCSQIFFA